MLTRGAVAFVLSILVLALGSQIVAPPALANGPSAPATVRRPQFRDSRTAHLAIASDLYRGEIRNARRFAKNNNRNQLFRVNLHNPRRGRNVEAIFKPRRLGDGGGFNRSPMEYVAYELNRMLDMDYVPPAAYRRNLTINSRLFHEGAMVVFVDDMRAIYEVPESEWGVRRDIFLSDTRILDVLLHNSDRHRDNFAIGRHWATGRPAPVLLDHAAGLRDGASVRMDHDDAFGSGPIRVVSSRTFRRLQQLNGSTLRRTLGEFVSQAEISGILSRRDGIVHYFNELIREHGRDAVVIPSPPPTSSLAPRRPTHLPIAEAA